MTMNTDDTQRITQLERALAAQTDELAALRAQVNHERTERLALQQIVVPPLTQVRQDLELNIAYLTETLEAMRARTAGGGGLSADAALAAFRMMTDALGVLSDRQVTFAESTVKALRQLAEASSDQQLRLHAIEQLLAPVLEGRAKLMSAEA